MPPSQPTQNEMKHTPEPWTTTINGRDCAQVVDVDGRRIAMCIGQSERNEANAARIVACVNACAGMEDPAEAIRETKATLWALIHSEQLNSHAARTLVDKALRALGG